MVRGVVTGDNDFFFLTGEQCAALGIDDEFFTRAVGRTRDVEEEIITPETIAAPERRGRPTHLLSLEGHPVEPRALERLPLPPEVVEKSGLVPVVGAQLALF